MSRFADNLDLVKPDEYVPTTVQTLLAHLNLELAPRPQQEVAIHNWLQVHTPGRAMVFTLKDKGFGHLLEHPPSAPA